MKKKSIRYILIAAAIAVGIALFRSKDATNVPAQPRDYAEICQSKVLRAVTEYNAVSYHVAQDTFIGFDYEMLQAFAKQQGLRLEVTPEMGFEKRIADVISGRYDILATGTSINSLLKDTLSFTHPLMRSKLILAQRKGKETDSTYISNQLQLAHKTVYIIKGSPAAQRIHHLIAEIADTIYTEQVEDYGTEQLLAMVAEGDIDYAVCDESIARKSMHLFPNLDIHTDIGFTQLYAWGVNKHATALLDTLNRWLDHFTQTQAYKSIYNRYF